MATGKNIEIRRNSL